jgi:D-arginine dehydrogenase
MDAFPDEYDIAQTVDRIETVTTLCVDRVRSQWAGLRTFTPDRRFAVGFDPHHKGFFWCVGQGGYGIQRQPPHSRRFARD